MLVEDATTGYTPAPASALIPCHAVRHDSAQISALNPWLMLYYMTTGKNSSGVVINAGQTLTRQEALRLYTVENGWFSKEEDKLGSIEPGKLGAGRRAIAWLCLLLFVLLFMPTPQAQY